jgi:hypothetical protein
MSALNDSAYAASNAASLQVSNMNGERGRFVPRLVLVVDMLVEPVLLATMALALPDPSAAIPAACAP